MKAKKNRKNASLIENTKDRIKTILPKVEDIEIKVENNAKAGGYLTTIRFRSLGKEFIAKKTAPFYKESLEKTIRAINSQITSFRSKRLGHPHHRVDSYAS